MHKNFVPSCVCLTICFPRPFRSKIYKSHCMMHLDLQLFENNIQQQKPSALADRKGAHRRVQTAHRLQQTPVSASPSPLLSSLAPPLLPAMLHNQLRCIALSKEASSSKHRQSPVSCASMDQSPLGNPNCNLLTHKG